MLESQLIHDNNGKVVGFNCKCGHRMDFGEYVYRNWNEQVNTNCVSCGKGYFIIGGEVGENY